jgi:hypothetical protein
MSTVSYVPFQKNRCYARVMRKLQYCQCEEQSVLVNVIRANKHILVCRKHYEQKKSDTVLYQPETKGVPNNIRELYHILYIMTMSFSNRNVGKFTHRHISSHLPTVSQFHQILDLLVDMTTSKPSVQLTFKNLKPEKGKNNKLWKYNRCQSILNLIQQHADFILNLTMSNTQLINTEKMVLNFI